jgi:hypothetical protein
VETDLCATVYKYVKSLVDKSNGKVENWRNISEWLEEAGYKSISSIKVQGLELLPEKSIVNITNIHIEQNQLVIAFNLRIPTQLSSDLPIENLGKDIFKDLQ